MAFDLWANGYEREAAARDTGAYPFAGYREILRTICDRVLSRGRPAVLDIGHGAGVLTAALYARGCEIFGQDQNERALAIARAKMPGARLYAGDFTRGLAPALRARRYDCIVATYALHHLLDARKAAFLRDLQTLLRPGGTIWIGDLAFPTRAALEAFRAECGDEWDDDEDCFVYDELARDFGGALTFERVSACAGILTLRDARTDHLELIRPSKALEREILAYRQAFWDSGEGHVNGSGGLASAADFDAWLERVTAVERARVTDDGVHASTFFSRRASDGLLVGSVQLRHALTPSLSLHGGHIGYAVHPAQRRRGYGAEQLRLALDEARGLGLARVMITCDPDNAASARTATACGGAYDGVREGGEAPQAIYWIAL